MSTGTAVGGGFTTGKLVCASAVTVGAGGAILVFGSYTSTVGAPTSCTDGTNTYTLLDSASPGFGELVCLYGAFNVPAGSYTPQINLPGNPGDGGILAVPLSGRVTASSPFGTPIRNQLATTNLSLGSALSLSGGDDVVVMLIDVAALRSANEYAPGTGFVERGEVGTPGSNFLDLAAECKDNVFAGSIAGATVVATQTNLDDTVIWGITVASATGGGAGGGTGAYTDQPRKDVPIQQRQGA